jgi:adenylate cyclase
VSATGISSDLAGKAPGGRKLIAVVYADMVGYSHLIGLDDAGTLRRLRTLRRALIDPAIREHGGRVVQTGGDSLLVVFDSIDGAVRCAIKVQQQVPVYDGDQPPDRRIRFRVGINTGDAIPHGTDLHGDGVNIAARLEAECPVGGICISRAVLDQVHLDLPFEAIGPLTLKNIGRPVEAFVLRLDSTAKTARWTRSRTALFAGIAGLLLVGASGAGWWLYRGAGTVPPATQVSPTSPPATVQAYTPPDTGLSKAPRLSIVVLPFENLSGDPKDDYLADGITDDLTGDLSNLPDAFVIARESAYTYKGKPADVRRIGEELGVRYVLEGSVRKIGTTLRVNVQLTSSETGAHLWSDRFDEQISELAAGQEQIVTRMRSELGISLVEIEKARSLRERPTNPDALDLVLQARALENQPPSLQRNDQAKALYERALERDPSSVAAMLGIAFFLVNRRATTGSWGTLENMQRAESLLSQARAIAPASLKLLNVTGYWLQVMRRYGEAEAIAEEIVRRFPNYARGYYRLAQCKIFTGHAEEAIPLMQQAVRVNPRDPYLFDSYRFMGDASLLLGRDRDAITFFERSLAVSPDNDGERPWTYRELAAAYARSGQMPEAKRALAEADRLSPYYYTVRSDVPDPSVPVYAEQVRRVQAALRLAGERDHADEDADFGVAADGVLHSELGGLTPTTAPGVRTIRTKELAAFLAEARPLVIDASLYMFGRSIPGAVGLENVGLGGSFADAAQDHLRRKVHELTGGDLNRPIVAVGWNSETFRGRNLALRLVALGFTNVYWYRGGREAWEVAGQPETELDVQDW